MALPLGDGLMMDEDAASIVAQIKLTPMERTLYILFLRYPSGINVDDRFKKVEFLNPKFQPKRWEMILCWLIDR